MAITPPIIIFRSAPRDIVVSRLLTEFSERPEATNDGEIVRMDSDAEFMFDMFGHVIPHALSTFSANHALMSD